VTITIGIDPGLGGAIAVLNCGRFVSVTDMPTTLRGVGSVKYEVNGGALAQLLKAAAPADVGVSVALERVNAMPGQGVSSVFSLGDSFGSARTAVGSVGFELHLIPPAKWKKHFGLSSDKEAARALAVRLFPEAPLGLKKYVDRAEALLIARWLWETNYE
jgi:crossover junction endodeoxyribonuclease RuvC